jgi:hypothetical protein
MNVVISIEIDQGGGMKQRGVDSFKMGEAFGSNLYP